MRKIFSILVTLMVIGLTFMSCTPATSDTKNGTGSSTGIDNTVPPTSNDKAVLKNFLDGYCDDITLTPSGWIYYGKIKGTENDYVIIPATASISEFHKKGEIYSLGKGSSLISYSVEIPTGGSMNIYLFCWSCDSISTYLSENRTTPTTIEASSYLSKFYFNKESFVDEITINSLTFTINISY